MKISKVLMKRSLTMGMTRIQLQDWETVDSFLATSMSGEL